MNQLILGDCLDVLNTLDSDSVDLIYLDPPFFSNRNYEVIWGDQGEIRSFQDRWAGGLDHYIAWLKERVQALYRVLKTTGSLFLHCDWHADAYIRVYILDKLFGDNNFRGNIVWRRAQAHNDAKKKIAVLSDTIWYFSKSDRFVFNPIYVDLSETSQKLFKYEDKRGKYRYIVLTGPGISRGESGQMWRGYNPTDIGRSWAVPNIIVTEIVGSEQCKRMTVIEKLELLYENGFIMFSKKGIPRVKKYLTQSKGAILGNIWTDIAFGSKSKERIGYPTQKPEALLKRIIECASNEGDVVLDPFIGGGTTAVVAERLKRQWIGIDQSVAAIKVTELRLHTQQTLFSQPFTVQLHKYDYDTLRYQNAFAFENWIITQYGGVANTKQQGDLGIDGRTTVHQPIQVKRSDNVGRNVIDNFKSACERYDKTAFHQNKQLQRAVGVIIAFSFGKGALQEVARLNNEEGILITLVTVEDIVPLAKKPTLSIECRAVGVNDKQIHTVELTAIGQAAVGIEFYAWDFNYDPTTQLFKPSVIRDTTGIQTAQFAAGQHYVAVKVIDNDGLEQLSIVQLQINSAGVSMTHE